MIVSDHGTAVHLQRNARREQGHRKLEPHNGAIDRPCQLLKTFIEADD
jgi:hypothetical protein